MKLRIIFSLFILICSINSCKEQTNSKLKTKPKLKVKKFKIENDKTKIRWIKWIPPNNDTIIEQEIYLYPNGDTLFNQHKLYVEDKIIPSKSIYYDLQLKKQSPGKFLVALKYFSPLDTINSYNNITREITLEYLQNDSIKTLTFKNENPIMKFEYFNNDSIFYGMLIESSMNELGRDDYEAEKDDYEMIFYGIMIDNSNPTKNPARMNNKWGEIKN